MAGPGAGLAHRPDIVLRGFDGPQSFPGPTRYSTEHLGCRATEMLKVTVQSFIITEGTQYYKVQAEQITLGTQYSKVLSTLQYPYLGYRARCQTLVKFVTQSRSE